jgi:hypothetical protein
MFHFLLSWAADSPQIFLRKQNQYTSVYKTELSYLENTYELFWLLNMRKKAAFQAFETKKLRKILRLWRCGLEYQRYCLKLLLWFIELS